MIRLIPRRQPLYPALMVLALAASGTGQTLGTLTIDPTYVPLGGGELTMKVDAGPAHAGAWSFILGSASGTGPGMNLAGIHVALNPDRFTFGLVHLAQSSIFKKGIERLDTHGQLNAYLKVPAAVFPAMQGATFHFAALFADKNLNGFIGVTPSAGARLGQRRLYRQTFSTMLGLDPEGTGIRLGAGGAHPGRLGESGVLGSFHPDMFERAKPVNGVLTLNTGAATVSRDHTLTGDPITVKDGVFRFADFIVPANLTIRFIGAPVARIYASGTIRVEGRILADGGDAPAHDGSAILAGAGGVGHCGGAPGGAGALKKGPGQDGGAVAFPPGSPWHQSAKAKGAAGRGATMFPANSGLITFNGYDGWVCAQCAAGGSGGSNFTAGTAGGGRLTGTSPRLPQFRLTDVPPPVASGSIFPYLATSTASVADYLAGGSGGGGGGSNPVGSMKGYTEEWHTGQGGGAGGGAILFRCGADLEIKGTLSVRGGASPNPVAYKRAMPGGGGSGGNILMQAGGRAHFAGSVVATGGSGGSYSEIASYNWTTGSYGGDGGDGYLRVEADPAPALTALVGFNPAPVPANVGRLTDRDGVTAARSTWIHLGATGTLHAFQIHAFENGQPVTYADNTLKGRFPVLGKTPVVLFLQGARRLPGGGVEPGSRTRWYRSPHDLFAPGNRRPGEKKPDLIRYMLILDTKQLSAPATLVVSSLELEYYD